MNFCTIGALAENDKSLRYCSVNSKCFLSEATIKNAKETTGNVATMFEDKHRSFLRFFWILPLIAVPSLILVGYFEAHQAHLMTFEEVRDSRGNFCCKSFDDICFCKDSNYLNS